MHSTVHAGRTMSRFFSMVIAISLLVMMVPGATAGALVIDSTPDTWYVDSVSGDDANGGMSSGAAFESLTQAMSVSGPNDTIILASGTYANEDYPFYIDEMRSPLAIVGADAEDTVLDGQEMASLFMVESASVTFDDLAFANGREGMVTLGAQVDLGGYGGAVSLYDSEATFTGCVFENNNASRGGAIYASNSDVAVEECDFSFNGVLVEGAAVPVSVEADEIPAPEPADIVCLEGGAIDSFDGSLEIIGSSFVGNEAYFAGSAVLNYSGIIDIEDSSFDSNMISRWKVGPAESGALFEGPSVLQVFPMEIDGTVTAVASEATVSGSQFDDNLAFAGAGLLLLDSLADISECDFSENVSYFGPVVAIDDGFMASIPSADDAIASGVEPLGMPTGIVLERSRITSNQALAGVFIAGPEAAVSNCLIADNYGFEVALAAVSSEFSYVTNTTIANNGASFAVAGDSSAPTQVYNSILWDGHEEVAPGCDVYYSDLFMGIGDPPVAPDASAQVETLPFDTNIYADPMFASPVGGNYRLVAGSPCIDSGTDFPGAPVDDLDGLSRPVDGDNDTVEEWDMGCYEYFSRTRGRVSGADRFETAVEISRDHFAVSDVVVLATGRTFADGLAASGLAGVHNAPLLLTDATDLPDVVATEIERLGASTVIVVGGPAAVSRTVASDLEDMGIMVERIGGADRYETAAMIAEEIIALDPDAGDLMFIARGDLFADALTASPVAYANHAPVLLVQPSALPPATVDIIEVATTAETKIVVVGGTSAVGVGVAAQVDATDRIDGSDRYDTAANFSEWATDNSYAMWNVTGVATGMDFPDALSGGAGIGSQNGVLLLTPADSVHPSVDGVLTAYGSSILKLQLFGGVNAVNDATKTHLMNYLP